MPLACSLSPWCLTCEPKFLGQLTDLQHLLGNLTIQMRGATENIAKAQTLIKAALTTGRMTPAEASKLEGTFAGKPLAGATAALIARQYWDQQHRVTPHLHRSLEILQLALSHVLPLSLIHI